MHEDELSFEMWKRERNFVYAVALQRGLSNSDAVLFSTCDFIRPRDLFEMDSI